MHTKLDSVLFVIENEIERDAMSEHTEYLITIRSSDEGEANKQSRAFADFVREIGGVEQSIRRKGDVTTMDLGTIVSVVVASGAVTALGQGLADWLRARRGTKLTIERTASSGSLKAVVEGIDPGTAEYIIEVLKRVEL